MSDAFTKWRDGLLRSGTITPLSLGISQEDVVEKFGPPDKTSALKKKGRALVLQYADIEFHFDAQNEHRLFLIYSEREDGSPRVSIKAASTKRANQDHYRQPLVQHSCQRQQRAYKTAREQCAGCDLNRMHLLRSAYPIFKRAHSTLARACLIGSVSAKTMALDNPILFAATTDGKRCRAFYEGVLGLRFISEDQFAVVFAVGAVPLRIQKVERKPKIDYTVLGWTVRDISEEMRRLSKAGVQFARYEGLGQDEHGMWRSPSGAKIAWFADPDGNTLSLTQP